MNRYKSSVLFRALNKYPFKINIEAETENYVIIETRKTKKSKFIMKSI